jgi:hypothetical protein
VKKELSSVLAIMLACVLPGLAMSSLAQTEDATGSSELEAVIDVIRDAYNEAQKALKQLPQERFETESVLEKADYDSDALVAWFEQNTRWVPYRGVLRGADGVLLDGTGNSLDRSLLLARLLNDAGYDARLVRGRLSAEAVEAVLSRASASVEVARPKEPLFVDQVVTAAQRAPSEASVLAELVGTLPERTDPELGESVADHWWVEAELDEGWTTIDPLLSGPLASMRPAVLERLAPESLPDALFHQVTLRVVIERWESGKVIEEIPLEHVLRTADAAYHDYELQFSPYHFVPAPDGSTAVDEAQAIAETAEEWLPVLRHGSSIIQQQGFDREGHLERNPGRFATVRKAEQGTAALQALGGSDEGEPAHLTALWLEYQVDVPGREPSVVRREIFDLIGPSRRRSGAIANLSLNSTAFRERGRLLLGAHRVVVLGAMLPPVALRKAANEYWANHGPQIAGIVRLANGSEDDEVLQRAYAQPLISLDLLGLATARHSQSAHRSSIYLESPNILTSHFMVELEEPYSVGHAYDIVINEVGVTANTSLAPGRVRLEQGMLDTILEATMSEPDHRSGNTAELFASRGDATGAWQRVDTDARGLALPGAAQARVADALDRGLIVVAPGRLEREQEPAWWEIDPVTGTTLGIGSRGWGASAVSDVTMRGIGTGAARQGAKKIGFKIACSQVAADLAAAGFIRVLGTGSNPVVLLSPEALRMFIQYGCKF